MKLRRMTPLIHRCTSLLVGTALALAVGSALSVTLDISGVKVEDTLTTNTGTFFYFPSANFIETIPANTLQMP